MLDTTLLDSNEPLTMQALRDRFRDNDFSTQTSRYKFKTASSEKNRMYLKAKGIFRSFWNHQMKKLCKKGSLKNFSVDAPIRCLEESEEKLVAGTVMEILNAFINSLDNDIDRQIMYMRADGKNQTEIAAALGYANHTPVTKRLQRLKKQFETFKKINGKQMKEKRRKQMLPNNLSCKACVLLLDSLPYSMVHWLGQKNKYGYFKRRK